MSVFESIERHPAEYLPSGDKALLIAWTVVPMDSELPTLGAVLCLEDGRVVLAAIYEFKLDYRYDFHKERWVDVSRVGDGPAGDDDADADPQAGDDGSPSVP